MPAGVSYLVVNCESPVTFSGVPGSADQLGIKIIKNASALPLEQWINARPLGTTAAITHYVQATAQIKVTPGDIIACSIYYTGAATPVADPRMTVFKLG